MSSPQTPPRPCVTVIVLNWNAWAATNACVSSLLELTYPAYQVLVVDNGSTDSSVERIRAAHPGIELIESGANLGYAGGNNLGIRHALRAGADAVWILNNDTLADPAALAELVWAAGQGYEALATRQVAVDGESDWSAALSGDGTGQVPITCLGCGDGLHPAYLIMGSSLFLGRAGLERSGLFEESYFHYYEELDLAERWRRAGWALGLACRATVKHSPRRSAANDPQLHYYFVRNRLLFRKRFHDEAPIRVLRQRVELGRALQLRRTAATGNPAFTVAGALAIIDATRGRTGAKNLASLGRRR